MEENALIRLAKADIPALAALEKVCFETPWSPDQYAGVFDGASFLAFGIRRGEKLVSFVTLHAAAGEMEIVNIATHPEFRRRGHARTLLAHALQVCRNMGIQHGYLEVRRSNAAARGLYGAFGFTQAGVRKRYYPDNREDAVVMRLELA